MNPLDTLVDQDTSAVFQVTGLNANFPTTIATIGTFNSQTITLQCSADKSTFVDLYDGGTVTWTTTGQQRLLYLAPGYYRLTSSSGLTSVAVYVDGKFVKFNP